MIDNLTFATFKRFHTRKCQGTFTSISPIFTRYSSTISQFFSFLPSHFINVTVTNTRLATKLFPSFTPFCFPTFRPAPLEPSIRKMRSNQLFLTLALRFKGHLMIRPTPVKSSIISCRCDYPRRKNDTALGSRMPDLQFDTKISGQIVSG